MASLAQLRRDAHSRTPDKWYYNQRQNGRIVGSMGFPTRELAESFKRDVDESVASMLASGYKRREGLTDEIVEAKGWKVGDKEFDNFGDALLYMWMECPSKTIKGVF